MPSEKRFGELLVGDVFEKTVLKASQVGLDAHVKDVIELMIANPVSRKVYVVDAEGRYVGTVSTETILRLLGYRVGVRKDGGLSFVRFLVDAFKEDAQRIMVKGMTITKDTNLAAALDVMLNEHLNDLPVVDAEGKLIGELVSMHLFMEGKVLFEKDEADSA